MPDQRPILFTAFEPSGDLLGATLIAELRRRQPGRPICALGGPKMQAAGAELLETTTEHAKMLLGAASEAWTHKKRLDRLKRWLDDHPVAAVVPIDSPAANWSICGLVRRRCPAAKVIHLVCPQIWAWATWRVHKLKRLTDHVLCLLPYEVEYLAPHGVPATFVGHPLFEQIMRHEAEQADASVSGEPVVALLPGSRQKEIERNWPVMLKVFERVREAHPGLHGRVALRVPGDERWLRASEPRELPASVEVCVGQTDEVIRGCDAALVVAGTATLQVTAHGRPMVVVYQSGRLAWEMVGRFLIKTRTFALPNLIGESLGLGRLVPEFVPHFGDADEVARALEPLLSHGAERAAQLEGFQRVTAAFAAVRFGETAADVLFRELGVACGPPETGFEAPTP